MNCPWKLFDKNHVFSEKKNYKIAEILEKVNRWLWCKTYQVPKKLYPIVLANSPFSTPKAAWFFELKKVIIVLGLDRFFEWSRWYSVLEIVAHLSYIGTWNFFERVQNHIKVIESWVLSFHCFEQQLKKGWNDDTH